MYRYIRITFSTCLFILLFTSCNKVEEAVEVVDQGRFVESPEDEVIVPGNDDISLENSLVTLTKSRLYPGDIAIITFTARDASGIAINEGGLNVEFSLIDDGTSSGLFSATSDSGDGVYKAYLTAVDFGSMNTVRVLVDGNQIVQSTPYALQVVSGDYHREIELSTATDQDEYQVQIVLNSSNFDYSKVQSNGEDLRFFDELYNEQDFWIESWDPSGDSLIWVKVQDAGTDKLIVGYGNDSIPTASSVEEVFSYDVSKNIYYELSQAAGPENYGVSSYIDSNTVTVLTNSGTVSQELSSSVVGSFTDVVNGVISVDGPISARFLNFNTAGDSVAPLSFASTILSYPMSRGTDDWDLYNPSSSVANLTFYNYDDSGVLQNSNVYSIPAGGELHIDYNVSKMGLIESDVPIIGLYYHSNTSDAVVMMKPSMDVLGTAAKTGSIGIVEDGTVGTIYFSNGTSQAFSGDKGTSIDFSGGGDQEEGLGVRILSNYGVVAVSQADSDGSDSTSFWPLEEMGNDYLVPTNSQYLKIVCHEVINIIVTDPGGNDDSGVCTPSGGNNPGVIAFGSDTVVTFQPGTRVTGDGNFYMYYEYEDEDETNVISWKQARSYSPVTISTTVGEEEGWN